MLLNEADLGSRDDLTLLSLSGLPDFIVAVAHHLTEINRPEVKNM